MFLKPTALVPSAVQVVNAPEVGVPRTGLSSVGVFAKTKAPVPVSSVTAAAKLAEDGVPKECRYACTKRRYACTTIGDRERACDIGG
jgi:hypothetical protein